MVRWYSFDHFRQSVLSCVKYTNKMSVLIYVLCSLMNMSGFFHMKMFNTGVIKKIRNLLTIDRKCTSVFTVPIIWSYNSDQWHQRQTNASCLSHLCIFRVTNIIFLATHPVTFFIDLTMK